MLGCAMKVEGVTGDEIKQVVQYVLWAVSMGEGALRQSSEGVQGPFYSPDGLPEGVQWVVMHPRDYAAIRMWGREHLEIVSERDWLKLGLQARWFGQAWVVTSQEVSPGRVYLTGPLLAVTEVLLSGESAEPYASIEVEVVLRARIDVHAGSLPRADDAQLRRVAELAAERAREGLSGAFAGNHFYRVVSAAGSLGRCEVLTWD